MKKIYKVETKASTMFMTYDDEEQIVRFLDNEATNDRLIGIRDVEDDSSWEMFTGVEDFEKWLNVDGSNPDAPEIVDEAEFE